MIDSRARDPKQERFFKLLHERLDGPMDAERSAELDRLLEESAVYREYAAEQRAIQRELRDLPPMVMPEADLEAVWRRTVEAKRSFLSWRAVGLAAMLLLAVGVFAMLPSRDVGHDGADALPPDVAQAMAELRMVFEITDSAVRRSERATVDGLREHLTPALKWTPISKWIPGLALSRAPAAESEERVP